MAKSENKTQITDVDPTAFIAAVEHEQRRADALVLLDWFAARTGCEPRMWGPGLIGYGRYHYKYETGREGDFLMTGFSPRKASLSIYVMPGYEDLSEPLSRLGKHKMGKACLYVNKLADVDMEVLGEIVDSGLATLRSRYETFDT